MTTGAQTTAVLALEDGSVFRGIAFGARVTVVGEAVFNTSMTGYQEILTDPSYFGQIVTMTAPQIGNTGVTPEDHESDGPKAAGFVVRELSAVVSNWRSRQSLPEWLAQHGVPGITGVDTRAITRRLRAVGAMKSCLDTTGTLSDAEAVARARDWAGLVGIDYVKEVTCREPYRWDPDGSQSRAWRTEGDPEPVPSSRPRYPVVAYDYGIKRNILRQLSRAGFDVTVVPADFPAAKVKEMQPAGVFLSNGPGDPAAVTYAHRNVQSLINDYPMFGICLGHQIITHAIGANTFKLKFGHRGGNQPVKNTESQQVSITAQNHGFASQPEELRRCGALVTEVNLNDGSVAGLRLEGKPVFAVQYHPEASPGPHDSNPLFEHFYELVASRQRQ